MNMCSYLSVKDEYAAFRHVVNVCDLSGLHARIRSGSSSRKGFSLIELMLVVCIVGIVSGIAIPAYTNHRDKLDAATAAADITNISLMIEKFYSENNRYPVSLGEIGMDGLKDPWDREYQYLSMANDPKNNNCRKYGPVHPLNTDYDLFSAGKDGRSTKTIQSALSHDDIIRAYNGSYIGLAKDII